MKLKVLQSGSKGNCYFIYNKDEVLILDCGIPYKEILRELALLNLSTRKVVGTFVSHLHCDHSLATEKLRNMGIRIIYPSMTNDLRIKQYGGFVVKPFALEHDVPCYGLYITHNEIGNMLYITDTSFCHYKFKDISHFLIECNHSIEHMDQAVEEGFNPYLANRVVSTHMSLETCKEFLECNVSKTTKSIIICHLSEARSNEKQFTDEIHALTKKPVYVANKGLEIDLRLCPI